MIEIDVNNGYEQNEYKPFEMKYEYPRILLEEQQSKYIYVPLSVITDTKLDIRRVAVFSYLRFRCGLDNVIGFTIPDIVEWYGGKPDRTQNGNNAKCLSVIDDLCSMGYLTYLTDKSKSTYIKCEFNMKHYYDECSDGYAAIYLDEIKKITSYKKDNLKNSTINNSTILLIFAYLRNKIRRRPNELKPEERSSNGIKERRERIPDAYESNIIDIANEIGIHKQTVSKIIDILEYELNLIVTDRAYRVKNENNEYRTLPTIFTNSYKREDKYLLSTDDNYSRTEIELKANNIKQYYQGYKIDKKKRKNNMKGGNDCE